MGKLSVNNPEELIEAFLNFKPNEIIDVTIDGIEYKVQVPENIDENTNIIVFARAGGEGVMTSSKFAFEELARNNANTIMLVPVHTADINYKGAAELYETLQQNLGTRDVMISTLYSGVNHVGTYTPITYLSENPDKSALIIMNAPRSRDISAEHIEALAQSNIFVIAIDDFHGDTHINNNGTLDYENLALKGVPVFLIEYGEPDSNNHGDSANLAAGLGLYSLENYPITLPDSDFVFTYIYVKDYQKRVVSNLKYYYYDINGNKIEFESVEAAQEWLNNALADIGVLKEQLTEKVNSEFNISEYENLLTSTRKETEEGNITTDKYNLKNIEDKHLVYLQNSIVRGLLGKEITSNLQYVESSMNEIRAKVRETAYTMKANRSASRVLTRATYIIKLYYSAVEELSSSLAQETESVLSAALAMVDMDADLRNEALKLNNGQEI